MLHAPHSHLRPHERLLQRLADRGPVRKVPGGWLAHCPAHEDRKASLSVGTDNGVALVKCFAGCDTATVVAALGLAVADLFPDRPASPVGTPVAHYDYRDADGRLVCQVVRYEPKDFRQRRPDGRGGWVWNLQGVPRVLYRLPELLAAPADRAGVRRRGREGRRPAGGPRPGRDDQPRRAPASGGRDYGDALVGRHVVVLPDNDDPGRAARRPGAAPDAAAAASMPRAGAAGPAGQGRRLRLARRARQRRRSRLLALAADAPTSRDWLAADVAPADGSGAAQPPDRSVPEAERAGRRPGGRR